MPLLKDFQPTRAQLSLKAALPLSEKISTVSDCCSNTGHSAVRHLVAKSHEISSPPDWVLTGKSGCISRFLLIDVRGITLFLYDNIMALRRFPYYWSIVKRIHPSSVDSPHKGSLIRGFGFSLPLAWTNCLTNSWYTGVCPWWHLDGRIYYNLLGEMQICW